MRLIDILIGIILPLTVINAMVWEHKGEEPIPRQPPKYTKMTQALLDLFPVAQAQRLNALYETMEPPLPEGDPDVPPQDASHSPEAVRRLVTEIVGEDGFRKLKEAAKPILPLDTDLTYLPLSAPPLCGWWIFVKDIQ